MDIRRVISGIMSVAGSVKSTSKEINKEYLDSIVSSDHAVLDVSNMSMHKGRFMLKADDVKVYVFYYSFGYVITFADPDLAVVSCTFPMAYASIYEMTDKPDATVAEMMADGTLVYIDTLAKDAQPVGPVRRHASRPSSMYNYPSMIVRVNWDAMPSKDVLKVSGMKSDGFVCSTISSTIFKTMRMKHPTIDLMYFDGGLYAWDNGSARSIVSGHPEMRENMIYELTVSKTAGPNVVSITRPHERRIKRSPNNMDVVRRAVASVFPARGLASVRRQNHVLVRDGEADQDHVPEGDRRLEARLVRLQDPGHRGTHEGPRQGIRTAAQGLT